MSDTYEIPVNRLDYVTKKLDRLHKKAKALGIQFEYELGETKAKRVKDQNERELIIEVVPITIIGKLPAIEGWKFAAKIEHSEEGNVIKSLTNIPIPKKYRKTGRICEHCNLNRKRNDTFLIRKVGTQYYKQVGRECLKDFTGHKNPAAFADVADGLILIQDILENESDFDPNTATASALDLNNYLTYVSYIVRRSGFVSKKQANESFEPISPTADVAASLIFKDKLENKHTPEDIDRKTAEKVIEWAKNIDENTNSTYLSNLHIIAKRGYAREKDMGMAASMVAAYNKEIAQNIAAKESEHVGEIGEKHVFNISVKAIRTFDSTYGRTHMYDMVDDSGNSILWYSSNLVPELEVGTSHSLMCTIKEHGEYKDIPQTKVNRCKIVKAGTKAPVKKDKKDKKLYDLTFHKLGIVPLTEVESKEEKLLQLFEKETPEIKKIKQAIDILIQQRIKLNEELKSMGVGIRERDSEIRKFEHESGYHELEGELSGLKIDYESKFAHIICQIRFLGTMRGYESKNSFNHVPSDNTNNIHFGLIEIKFTAGIKRNSVTLWMQYMANQRIIWLMKLPNNTKFGYGFLDRNEECAFIYLPKIKYIAARASSISTKDIYPNTEKFIQSEIEIWLNNNIKKIKASFGEDIKNWGAEAQNKLEYISELHTEQIV